MLAQSINLFAPARKESCAQFSTQLGAHFLRFPFTSHQPQQLTLFQIEVGNLSKESRTVSSLIPISQEQFQIFRFCNKLLLMKNTMSDDELHIPCSMDFQIFNAMEEFLYNVICLEPSIDFVFRAEQSKNGRRLEESKQTEQGSAPSTIEAKNVEYFSDSIGTGHLKFPAKCRISVSDFAVTCQISLRLPSVRGADLYPIICPEPSVIGPCSKTEFRVKKKEYKKNI